MTIVDKWKDMGFKPFYSLQISVGTLTVVTFFLYDYTTIGYWFSAICATMLIVLTAINTALE